MSLAGRKPTLGEKAWMDAAVQSGCIVCRLQFNVQSPAEIHHLDGKTKPGAHYRTIPLCHNHHRAGVDEPRFTSRHPFKFRFEQRYGSEQSLLEKTQEIVEQDEKLRDILTVKRR